MISVQGYAAHQAKDQTPTQGVNAAYERVLQSDVRYRFVIDMKTLR